MADKKNGKEQSAGKRKSNKKKKKDKLEQTFSPKTNIQGGIKTTGQIYQILQESKNETAQSAVSLSNTKTSEEKKRKDKMMMDVYSLIQEKKFVRAKSILGHPSWTKEDLSWPSMDHENEHIRGLSVLFLAIRAKDAGWLNFCLMILE